MVRATDFFHGALFPLRRLPCLPEQDCIVEPHWRHHRWYPESNFTRNVKEMGDGEARPKQGKPGPPCVAPAVLPAGLYGTHPFWPRVIDKIPKWSLVGFLILLEG